MFGCIGISHREARAGVRDRVAFTPEAALRFRQAAAAAGVRETLTLSTCNRTEVFYWGDAAAAGTVRDLFVAGFPGVDLSDCLRSRTGDEALVYLCRVAAGLESMVLGEYQILGQVKEAHAAALATGHVGKALDRILRDAVTCAKRVKTELDIGAVPPSVCRAGMELVDRAVGLVGKRVFVIGSGRTGTLAAKLAKRLGAGSIAVCNRSPERAGKLVEQVGATVVDYAARYDAIAASDVVVSATASPHVVVKADLVRLEHPVCFLDLASPRDVEPAVAAMALATLVSIDTIGELAAGDRAERERLTAKGMTIVEAAVRDLSAWLEGATAGDAGARRAGYVAGASSSRGGSVAGASSPRDERRTS